MTAQQIKNLEELHLLGGAVMSSTWTNGSGRFTTSKAIPPYCGCISIKHLDKYDVRGWVRLRAEFILKRHPQCREIVYIANLRAARALLRQNWITPTTYRARSRAAYKARAACRLATQT